MLQTLQSFLNLFDAPSYLEIGVHAGATLHKLSAYRKVAVDIHFPFDVEVAHKEHPETDYYQVRSDEFFASYRGPSFDVVYIDGLHTSEQTLRDLLNTLAFTKPNSAIIVDDVFPSSYAASLPSRADTVMLKTALGDKNGAWMGDVYRLVYFIETFMQQYSFASPIGGNPQLVLWREARTSVPERTLSQVGGAGFVDLIRDREMLRTQPLEDIVAAAKAAGVGTIA